MMVMQRLVPLALLFLVTPKIQSYLDGNGVPKEGMFGYRGIQKNLYCLFTADWSREKKMLEAFDNVLNPKNENKAEDLKTFKEKFYPEDCGRHPRLVQQALENNRPDLIEFMQEKGLNVKNTFQEHCVAKAQQKTYSLQYPLHAVIKKHGDKGIALVSLMITKLKFDPHQKDSQGDTLMHVAVNGNSLQMIQKLRASININEKNSKGNTPAHEVAAKVTPEGLKALSELLQSNNFDPNVTNDEGETSLFFATKSNNKEGAALLLAKGAKTVHKNHQEDTPLHIAARIEPPSEGEALFEQLLTSMDFDPEIADGNGKRIIDINNEQEECYCNPLNNNAFASEEEILDRMEECRVVRDRKKGVLARLARMFVESDRQLTDEQNAEVARKMREEKELEKKQSEEEAKRAEEAEKIVQKALLEKKLHDEKEHAKELELEEFEKTKNAKHEKREAAIMKFYNDNN